MFDAQRPSNGVAGPGKELNGEELQKEEGGFEVRTDWANCIQLAELIYHYTIRLEGGTARIPRQVDVTGNSTNDTSNASRKAVIVPVPVPVPSLAGQPFASSCNHPACSFRDCSMPTS
ncbi:hypothetical protein IFR05_007149 [Cadophora sp. M221]|nr:hypothetical protein IFR05_007149 [Cadophora sp. M221]